jgi:hypothetical protein
LEQGQDKVVYGQAAPDQVSETTSTTPSQQTSVELASSEAATEEPTINSDTDYMSFISWMYPSKGNQAPAQSADKPSEEPEINGVEDYMSWMYKDRK